MTPSFKPKLSKHSAKLMENNNGNVLTRAESHLKKKQELQQQLTNGNTSYNSSKEDCSFHPTITKKSSKMNRKSSYELSQGNL